MQIYKETLIMAQIYLKVLIIMGVLFAFAVPGFALKKLKLLGERATFTLSNILLYVCQPALAISSFCALSDVQWAQVSAIPQVQLLKNFGVAAAISFFAMALTFGLCKLVFLKSKNRKKTDIYSFIAVFSNCGFLGVPFTEMLTDGDPLAVMYVMVFNVVFNFLCWTLGVVLITGDFKEIRLKKLICNPSIISNFIAMLLFFVPKINFFMFEELGDLQIFPRYLAHMTAPLSMIIVGIRLAECNFKELFCNAGIYFAGGLRLLIAPFIALGVSVVFYFMAGNAVSGEFVFIAPVIAMSMSPAASVVAMAERFDGDKKTATDAFINNTVLSVLIIPLTVSAVIAVFGLLA